MEQIKILFFVLGSFFGMEDGRIASDKTIVTIDPVNHKIEIVQENVFAFIQSEKDTALALAQWDKIKNWKEGKAAWAKELEIFSEKNLNISSIENKMLPKITFSYTDAEALRVLGIWYNTEKNEFSINHVPRENVKTEIGLLERNYWVFKGDNTFSYSIEPFLDIPENYQKFKYPIVKLLQQKK